MNVCSKTSPMASDIAHNERDAFAEGDIRRQQIAFMNKFPTKRPGRVKPIPAVPTQQPVPDSLREKTTKESPRVQGRSGPLQPRRRDSHTRSAHSAMSRRSSASQKSSPRDPLKLETNNILTRLILEQNLYGSQRPTVASPENFSERCGWYDVW